MIQYYQWILRNNQESHYPRFVVTEKYYPSDEVVREYCCVDNLFSPLRRIEESAISLEESPYLAWAIVRGANG